MPQVDLESFVCGVAGAGAGDRKVSCETVIAGESGDASPPRMPPPDPDFPPESITIPIGDEVAFSELNPIYDRDDSTKGSTNPKSAAGASNGPIPAKSRSNSTRIAGAPAAATTFFGLPASIRPAFTRRRPSQGRILPDKRSGGRSGRGDGEEEPRSPKVSCIGKVLSDRERYGRSRGRRWWRGLVAVFLCGGGGGCSCQGGGGRHRHATKKVALDEDRDGDDEKQPGIAAMRRFKSGRRTASWVEEAIAAAEAAGEEEEEEEEQQQQDDAKTQDEKAERHDTEQWAPRLVS
ncbi:histone-lysine N-methyltransferase EHMT2-like [Oryza brachyantha]|uniref:histone-lysine N-methyltransferase EHMT2-like n=1 Tax=Oryza brachyantha TaxID=4533 RepID=UPI001AD9A214|nr:histone-lysine N-methyltransferase EHMT2-like [Oryza brachyantha]